jgi:hypothetical protein
MSAPVLVRQYGGGVRITVRVQPRASRAGVEGVHGDAWRVRVQAPPADGAANAAVCELFADALRVPRRSVRLVAGLRARVKIIEIDDISVDTAEVRLAAAMGDR